MPADLLIRQYLSIPASELSVSFSRSSGKGGQNVNKVNSKVTLRWSPRSSRAISTEQKARFLARFANRITSSGVILLSCDTSRDQSRNIETCRKRLAEMIRSILAAPKKRIATKPGKSISEERLRQKKAQAKKKQLRRNYFDSSD